MCSVRCRMRSVSNAICTSAEPVSVSWSLLSLIVAALSGMRAFEPSSFRHRSIRIQPARLPDPPAGPRLLLGKLAHPLDIGPHLRDQVVDVVEALLAPQEPAEPHPGLLIVEIALEIEDVRLAQTQARVGVEGRAPADGDRRPPGHAVG